uniref:Uncharacterized protein n=1 Tax=Anguilla anguilla TaxID=7936 RepID=A0A0E9SLG5_ANGAN
MNLKQVLYKSVLVLHIEHI